MKKKLSLALAILFTIFTLPINGISVKANDKTYDNIADGTYDITAKALNEKENKPSGAANFINEEAKLIIKDDKAQLQITVPEVEIASIDGIQIEKQEAKIEKKDKSKVYIFSLKKIKKELKSQVQYSVPIMNMVHDVPFRFILEDLDKLPKKPVIETKDEKKEETIKFETIEKNDQSLEKGHTKTVQEGKNGLKELSYKVTFTDGKETHRKLIEEKVIKEPVNKIVLKGTKTNIVDDKETNFDSEKEKNNAIIKKPKKSKEINYQSDMDLSRYFNNPAKSIEKNGKKYIQITGNMGQYIEKLVVEGKDAKLGNVNKDGTYIMQFEVTENLSKKLDFKMVVNTGSNVMEHETKLWFGDDMSSEPKPSVTLESTDEKTDKNKEVKPVKVPNKETKKPKNNKETVSDKQLVPDKTYEINYKITEETGNSISVADNFFVKPAKLLEKNGILYAQVTIESSDMVKELKTKYGKALEVKKNKNNSKIVQFKVDKNLLNMNLEIQVEVPGMYSTKHNTILQFDKKSKKTIIDNKLNLVASKSENGPNPQNGSPVAKTIESKNEVVLDDNNNSGKHQGMENSKVINNKNILVSDKASTINFSIKHANGKETSVADEFFKKPATLIEKDGNMYAQLTIKNGNMVKNLKTEYGEVNILKVNKDGSIVVQFKVKKDLSNMKLKMLISVPGLYTAEHDAILVFDKNSKTAIKDNEFSLPGNGDNPKLLSFGAFINSGKGFNGLNSSGNDLYHKIGSLSQSNGSHFSGFGSSKMSTPNLNNKLGNTTSSLADGLEKPEFGSAGSDSQINQVSSNNNPKTGDTSLIWLYGILLVGSLAILVVKLRRRTI